MKLRFALYSLTCSLLVTLAACSSASEPPTSGELTTFDAVCNEANEGKRLALEGYLSLPTAFTGDFSVVMRLFETAERNGTPVGSTMEFGEGPHTLDQVPTQYSDADLKFRAHDGTTLGYLDKVRLSGTMYYPASSASVDFTCGLTNPLIEKVSN